MGELAAFVKEHPVAIFAAVGIVALIAYMQSQDTSSPAGSSDVSFVGGGVTNRSIDPGVVSIEQARIQAGSTNLSTLAQLILGQDVSGNELQANEHQTDAQLTASLASTSAALTSSLAATQANKDTSLAATQASVAENSTNANAATVIAGYTAQAQAAITAANLRTVELNAQNEATALQFHKDEARASDNTNITDTIVNGVVSVVKFLSLGFL